MVALLDRDRLDNVHPALRACWHPVCASGRRRGQRSCAVRLLGEDWAVARIDGRAGGVVDRCPHRWLAAQRRLRRRRRRAVRLPRLPLRRRRPVRRGPGARRRLADPAEGATCRRPAPSSSATGWSWLAPEEPLAPIIDVPEWDDPAFVVAPAARPGVARRRRADGRQLPRPRPLPVHSTRPRSATPTTSRCRRTPSSATASAFSCDYVHSTKRLADSMGADEFEVADAPLDVVVRRPVRDAPAHRVPRRRRRADDPVLPPAGRRHARPSCTASTSATTSPTVARRSTTRWRSSSPSPPRTRRCSSASSSKAIPLDLQAEVHTRADRITRRDAPRPRRPRRAARRSDGRDARPSRPPVATRAALMLARRRRGAAARAVDRRRARRLGERHGRHAGRGRRADRRRATPATSTPGRPTATVWSAAARASSIGGALGVRRRARRRGRPGPAPRHHPARRDRQRRAVGRGRARACSSSSAATGDRRRSPPSPCSSSCSSSTTVGLVAPRRGSAHDVLHRARRPARVRGSAPCSSRRAGRPSLDGLKLAAPAALAGRHLRRVVRRPTGARRAAASPPCRAAVPSGCGRRRCSARRAGCSRSACSAGLRRARRSAATAAAIAQRQPTPPVRDRRPVRDAVARRAADGGRRRCRVVAWWLWIEVRRRVAARRPPPVAGRGRTSSAAPGELRRRRRRTRWSRRPSRS